MSDRADCLHRRRAAAPGLLALALLLSGCGAPGRGPAEVAAPPIAKPLPPAAAEPPPSRAAARRLSAGRVEMRRRVAGREPVALADMRRLADHDDGYAAWLLAEDLRGHQRWDLVSDMAHYYAVAAASGRRGGVSRLSEVLARPDFGTEVSPERLAWLEQVMLSAARRGDAEATAFLVDAYSTGHPFGRNPAAAISLLAEARGAAAPELALDMATGLIRAGGLDRENAAQVRDLLVIASAADSLQARITTANLMALLDSRAADLGTSDARGDRESNGEDDDAAD